MLKQVVAGLMLISCVLATTCRSSGKMCSLEHYTGQATRECCDTANGDWQGNMCWVAGARRDRYVQCCADWGCDRGVHD
ncbi:hypothetical protein BC940DRAFT_299331 [Gongronella butleri]|nr:hypothetical protein BC940DRAFT_299331 [Gongronella butleri]